MNTTTLKDLIGSAEVIDLHRDYYDCVESAVSDYDGRRVFFADEDYWPTLDEIRAQLAAAGYRKWLEDIVNGMMIESWYNEDLCDPCDL